MYFEEHITNNPNFPFRIQVSASPSSMLAHKHNRTELMYFYHTDGCEYRTHGETFQVKSGDLIISNPCEIHECFHFGNHAKVCCITVEPSFYTLESNTHALFENHVETTPTLRALFDKIETAVQEKNEWKALLLRAYLSELFACLLRDYTLPFSKRQRTSYVENLQKLTPVFEYVQSHLSLEISLHDLSQAVCLSESRFYHLFKEICGVSPTQYLVNARLERACKLLTETQDSITQIAFSCGFCDSSYFAKLFKKHLKLSPLTYRKTHFEG